MAAQTENPAERRWLGQLCRAVEQNLAPLLDSPAAVAPSLVTQVKRLLAGRLPLSSRCVSVSELLSTQRTACCCNLAWSTNQHREWTREAEQAAPKHRALPRTDLLLVGCLSAGRSCDERCWQVKDATGSVQCEVLEPSLDWLDQPMLFPGWNYIPHNAPGQHPSGYLELICSPVPVNPSPVSFDPGGLLSEAVGVKDAARQLRERPVAAGVRLCVSGEVSTVCPLLVIGGRSFFCFSLRAGGCSVPVLVTEPVCVRWRPCVCVGQRVCVSALRLCSLKGWKGHRVLSVTPQSRLVSDDRPITVEQASESPSPGTSDQRAEGEETDADTPPAVATVKSKRSKIISYKGVITEVTDEEAGLYVIDGKVGLCLAYQPMRRRGLRLGAEIELHNVHFLFRPSPHSLPTMLCACLRSSVHVTAFSRLGSEVSDPERSHGALPRFLLEKNLGVAEYLWLHHCCTAIRERLCPRWVRVKRVLAVAARLLENVCEEQRQQSRQIYREMMQEPHFCPLSQYSVCTPRCELLSVAQACDWLEQQCWSVPLASLLPASASHMTAAELNPALSWSFEPRSLQGRDVPAVLIGVLEVCSTSATLQLRDQSGCIDCVAVETSSTGDQRAAENTAWLGCLVCVRRCTLVVERFLKTNFPSWKHVSEEKHIIDRHCRVYLQLRLGEVCVLSPSAAMCQLIGGRSTAAVRAEETSDGGTSLDESRRGGKHRHEEDGAARDAKKPRMEVGHAHFQPLHAVGGATEKAEPSTSPSTCVSLAFCLQAKQGVSFRNLHLSAGGSPGLSPSFVATATRLGGPLCWEKDPKNSPLESREADAERLTLELQFISSSVRWFPLLQPGSVYRLVALHSQDEGVFRVSSVCEKGLLSSPSLLVQPQWRVHTLAEKVPSVVNPKLLSVSEVLHCSSPADIVSFFGVLSQRITLPEEKGNPPAIQSLTRDKGVSLERNLQLRLTLEDAETAAHSLQVYLDLSRSPYTPGLVAGATVALHAFQRRVSRVKKVYCRSLPISCITVTALGSSLTRSCLPPPMMLLCEWVGPDVGQQCIAAVVKVHVVCVLHLMLQWTCSLCGSVCRQDRCGRTQPPCESTSGVFRAEAKVAVEDGTGEAHVFFSSETVAQLLLLDAAEWEGLQRQVKVKGYIRLYARGRSMVSDEDLDDPLLQFLCLLCSSISVCRPITLTCQLRSHRLETQMKRWSRGDRDFITKTPSPLQLTCSHIREH
ncbi:CST complex subunit CTC1 isoform X1 [Denticeps clupeoides]|uniref:CST complex subunit CTC1 isoform X1 n=1 Tax=Denticeps clupeoides TaxID=299321 RepID=UPI0010A2EA64|nr:CST complex subunit CTC1 isoform X1 [Denticeps clupeoides]